MFKFFEIKKSNENPNENERILSITIYEKLKNYLVDKISAKQIEVTLVY